MKKWLVNVVGVAAVAYGSAVQSGLTQKAAWVAVLGAVLANIVGLVQQPPKKG